MGRLVKTTYKGMCFKCAKENANLVIGHNLCTDCHNPKKCHKCKPARKFGAKKIREEKQAAFYGATVTSSDRKRVRKFTVS